jgi:hypothetical protein
MKKRLRDDFRIINAIRPELEEQENPHSTLETAAKVPGRNKLETGC